MNTVFLANLPSNQLTFPDLTVDDSRLHPQNLCDFRNSEGYRVAFHSDEVGPFKSVTPCIR